MMTPCSEIQFLKIVVMPNMYNDTCDIQVIMTIYSNNSGDTQVVLKINSN
jgi:hypothetical protein